MDLHIKGKSVNTSVPTIAVRFNATAEEIEELYQSEDESSEPTNSEQTKSTADPESSPLRYLPRLGKRSVSTDNSLAGHDSSPTSDPWKFFSDIKGKITKNIEDKITEIKQRNEEGDSKKSKENLSDSEDISESSISKTCGAASTTEGVEMSTDDDTPSIEKDKKVDENPPQLEPKTSNTTSSSSGLRQRIKIKKVGSDNKDSTQEASVSLGTLGKLIELQTGVNPSSKRQFLNDSVEVESGVEALEDSIQNELPESKDTNEEDVQPEELIINVTENIENLQVEDGNSIVIQSVTGDDIKEAYVDLEDKPARSYFAPEGFVDLRGKHLLQRETWLTKLYSFRRFLYVICFIMANIYAPIPVYFSGFVAGIVFTFCLVILYNKFNNTDTPTTGYTNKPIIPPLDLVLSVPEIKEHIPISNFEGWMNEFPETYDPLTYHVSQTQSVYVKLQGNLLRISHTRAKIPKRAMWNEPKHKHLFTQHRIYNLLGAQVMLLPTGLHKKRHWSKKYPICIILHKDQLNFDCADEISCHSTRTDNNKEHSEVDDKKENDVKKKSQKKIIIQPQIYSKLTQENLDVEFDHDLPITELEQMELDNLTTKLHENLDDEEDFLSQNIAIQEDEQLENEILDCDDWSTYSDMQMHTSSETYLYLFGRTGREKEDWYRRFTTATHKGSEILLQELPVLNTQIEETVSETLIKASHSEEEYLKYMAQFIKSSKTKKAPIREEEYLRAINVLWLNAVIGRVLFDWSKSANITSILKDKIQKKLMTIKLPYFIEQLIVYELSLGNKSPLIHNASKPVLDQRGLWIDLDISYQGNITLTLQTKLNLMKLKVPQSNAADGFVHPPSAKWQSSEAEDTAESSTDDDGRNSPPPKVLDDKGLPILGIGGTSTKSKRIMRVVDKITESKIFQVATDNRYVKRAMEGVSNTDLSLKVEVKGLIGTLVLNIPPPPSDRLWLGFRPAPKIYLTAQPIVGERNISFIRYLTNWIEKKLCHEFQKLIVIPNMEDFSIPNMSPDLPK